MKAIKNIFSFIVFIFLFGVFFIFISDNKNIMVLNLFPFKMGISMPVYLYTLFIFFIAFLLGAMTHAIYLKAIYLKEKWRK